MDNTWFWFTNGTPGGEVLCGYMKSSSDFSVSFWRSDSASFLSAAPHLHWLHENSPLITDKTAWLPDPGSSKTYPAYSPVTYIKVDIRKATKKKTQKPHVIQLKHIRRNPVAVCLPPRKCVLSSSRTARIM